MTAASRPRTRVLVAIVVLGTVLAGCKPVFGSVSGPVHRGTLTSAKGMTYRYTGAASTLQVVPGSPADENVREVFWNDDTEWAADQEACARWDTVGNSVDGGPIQPGLALRIAPAHADNTGIKAVTVTENVWYYGVWLFNVHVWNSKNTAAPFTLVRSFDLSSLVGKITVVDGTTIDTMVAPPWYVCARAIGRTFSFMVWTGSNPRPSWNDPTHVFTTTLPAGWDQAGYAGGYIGHVRAGQSARFSQLTTTTITP